MHPENFNNSFALVLSMLSRKVAAIVAKIVVDVVAVVDVSCTVQQHQPNH